MSNELTRLGRLSRRTVLKASMFGVGALGADRIVIGTATDDEYDDDDENDSEMDGANEKAENEEEDSGVDEPEGFEVEVLAPHATFPDTVTAGFEITYDEGELDPITSDLPEDASTVVVAKVTWQPGGTSGWHTHPGPVVVAITEGELELVNERDCIARTYGAGEAFVDPGHGNIHIATNASETSCAEVYATFLGVPDGDPATVWVEPVEC